MFIENPLRKGLSKFWLTPDLRMGVRYFQCFNDDYYCLPHTHSEYNFVICLNGEMEFDRGGKLESIKAGDIAVLNSGEMHRTRYLAETCETIGLIINKSQLNDILRYMQLPVGTGIRHINFLGKAHDWKIVDLTRELLHELTEQKKGFDLLVQSFVVQILIYLFRYCFEPVILKATAELPPQLLHWELTRAIEYMNTHDNFHFSLSKLCREIGCSSSRFVPLFKNSTGLTPHSCSNRILVERAQRLLLSGDYTIKEVAYELGFRSLNHFYEVFHNLAGLTPRTYQLSKGQRNKEIGIG